MDASVWVAKTGLTAQQRRMTVIANNLANVNTVAFKRDRAVFEDLLYQNIRQACGSASPILPRTRRSARSPSKHRSRSYPCACKADAAAPPPATLDAAAAGGAAARSTARPAAVFSRSVFARRAAAHVCARRYVHMCVVIRRVCACAQL